MVTDLPSPTDAELTLLDELWRHSPQTVRELASAVHSEPTKVQYRTVQVLLDRLEKKSLVARDRIATPHRFMPTVPRRKD